MHERIPSDGDDILRHLRIAEHPALYNLAAGGHLPRAVPHEPERTA
jgi:hypothetical protein